MNVSGLLFADFYVTVLATITYYRRRVTASV